MSQDCRNVFLSPGYAHILKYISTGNGPGDFKGGNLHLSEQSCEKRSQENKSYAAEFPYIF